MIENMERFSKYCTLEQTKRAYKLGAPIKQETELHSYREPWSEFEEYYVKETGKLIKPTTQQMIGWLESNNIQFIINPYLEGYIIKLIVNYDYDNPYKIFDLDTKYDAELAAIDNALEYLENK